MTPWNCDVCGDEVSYSEKCFELRNGAEIVICSKHFKKQTEACGKKRPDRKTLCQLPKGHNGSCQATIFWEEK